MSDDDTGCNQPWSLLPEVRHEVYDAISPESRLRDVAKGKRVLVTGAGRGIGKAIATSFIQAGATGVALVSRNREQLETAAAELRRVASEASTANETKESRTHHQDPTIVALPADVCESTQVEQAISSAVQQLGGLDVVVANAGAIDKPASVDEAGPDEWWKVLANVWQETNVRGSFNLVHHFIKHVKSAKEGEGHDGVKTVIAVSDCASYFSPPGVSAHAISKTAINRLIEYVHEENNTSPKIHAFALHPGAVRTSMALSLGPEVEQYLVDEPGLAGGFAVWLACVPDAAFLSGRFVSAQWDVDALKEEGVREKVAQEGLLKTRVLMR